MELLKLRRFYCGSVYFEKVNLCIGGEKVKESQLDRPRSNCCQLKMHTLCANQRQQYTIYLTSSTTSHL